jgi:hypothetical protein
MAGLLGLSEVIIILNNDGLFQKFGGLSKIFYYHPMSIKVKPNGY